MKANPQQYARMKEAYHRFLASKLTLSAFCKAEGLKPAQFGYWNQRFSKEAAEPTPSQAINPPAAPITSSFTQVKLPPVEPIQSTPILVWDLGNKGKIEFYSMVEASFIKELIS